MREFELSVIKRRWIVGAQFWLLRKKKRIGIVWEIMNAQSIKHVKESNGKLLEERT